MWLAKDNRLLNPKSSYERILTAPPCRLIFFFWRCTILSRRAPIKGLAAGFLYFLLFNYSRKQTLIGSFEELIDFYSCGGTYRPASSKNRKVSSHKIKNYSLSNASFGSSTVTRLIKDKEFPKLETKDLIQRHVLPD